MIMPGARTFLVIEPNDESARRIEQVLQHVGASCRLAPDAEAGWRAFVTEPPHVVLTALNTPRRDGAWFIRRMRDEYLGALPATFALAADEELTPSIRELELDGVLLRPIAAEALHAIAKTAPQEEAPERQASRLRDLFELTLLGGDLDAGVKAFIDRVALVFRAADCVIWGPAHEERWPKTHRPILRPEAKAFLLWRCDLALTCGATIIAAEGLTRHDSVMLEGLPARSYLAASLDAPGARSLGALCLVDDQPRRFTA